MSRESKILIAILVVVVGGMIALFAIANGGGSDNTAKTGDKTKLVRDNSHKEGSGPVQVVEYGDYQCPACGAAYPNVKQLMKEYDGKVTLYFRNFPLTQLHPNAMKAAETAEAAAAQGKFWEMHDKLYETQKEWSDLADPMDKFTGYAKDLGLDADKLKSEVTAEKYKDVIDQDVADGNAQSINATPTFFFNGTMSKSGFDYASLRDAVDAALKAK